MELKQPPQVVFEDEDVGGRNYLRFRLSPDEVIALGARAKVPGEAMVGEDVELQVHCRAPATRCRRTSGSSATPWRATRRCSPARTPSRPPGASSTRSSTTPGRAPLRQGTWGPGEAAGLVGDIGGWTDLIDEEATP